MTATLLAPPLLLDSPRLLAPPVVDDATRREFLGVLVGAGLLSGCGADVESSPAPSSAPATRTFVDSLGRSVDIPLRPQRIVVTQAFGPGEALLALGAPLVGMEGEGTGSGFNEPISRAYDTSAIASIGTFGEINAEQIIALEPDLIIGYAFAGEWFHNVSPETLQAIAPMVALNEDTPRAEYQEMVASLAGLEDVLATQRAEYETALDAARADLGDKAATLSVATFVFRGGNAELYTRINPNPNSSVLPDLGVALPPGAEGTDLYNIYSPERLADPEIQADVILWDESSDAPATYALWATLPAVVAGQAHEVAGPAGTSYRTSSRVLATLMPLLQAADPATV